MKEPEYSQRNVKRLLSRELYLYLVQRGGTTVTQFVMIRAFDCCDDTRIS